MAPHLCLKMSWCSATGKLAVPRSAQRDPLLAKGDTEEVFGVSQGLGFSFLFIASIMSWETCDVVCHLPPKETPRNYDSDII